MSNFVVSKGFVTFLSEMSSRSNEYAHLCRAVEKRANRRMNTPRDFDFLSVCIEQFTHQHLGVSTLKRLWGYLGEDKKCNPRQYTLDILSRYVGYKDYEAFVRGSMYVCDSDSDFMIVPTLVVGNMNIGTRVRIMWNPDRVMIVRYEGDNTFIVEAVENSKLSKGDCFCCDSFTQSEPLYMYNLVHENNHPTGYVGGRLGGVRYDILNEDFFSIG